MEVREESPGNKSTMREAISGPEFLMAQQDSKISIATRETGGLYCVLGGSARIAINP
jgi:hypothetical protein